MKKEANERKLAFKCCIPSNISECSDDDLRLSLVTLKNARMNVEVCIGRLEKELERRGTSPGLHANIRETPSPELLELATLPSE